MSAVMAGGHGEGHVVAAAAPPAAHHDGSRVLTLSVPQAEYCVVIHE